MDCDAILHAEHAFEACHAFGTWTTRKFLFGLRPHVCTGFCLQPSRLAYVVESELALPFAAVMDMYSMF